MNPSNQRNHGTNGPTATGLFANVSTHRATSGLMTRAVIPSVEQPLMMWVEKPYSTEWNCHSSTNSVVVLSSTVRKRILCQGLYPCLSAFFLDESL